MSGISPDNTYDHMLTRSLYQLLTDFRQFAILSVTSWSNDLSFILPQYLIICRRPQLWHCTWPRSLDPEFRTAMLKTRVLNQINVLKSRESKISMLHRAIDLDMDSDN